MPKSVGDKTRQSVVEASGSLGTSTDASTGKYHIKIIEGNRWGSSGYYPGAVVERDGPTVFGPGTQMYLDHPTFSEETLERPERSVRDLIGTITSTPEWNAATASLEADVQFFSGYANMINEIAPHIGISINAYATMEYGEVAGQFGEIITSFLEAKSVDVVTKAGAGGAIMNAIESATGRSPGGVNAVHQRSGQQQKESAVADTTINTETLSALTTAMTSLTEALTSDQKARAEDKAVAEAAAAKAAETAKPDPLDVGLAIGEAKLPKHFAQQALESVKAGVEVEVAITAAKTALAEVLTQAGATVTKEAARIGAPAGTGATTTGKNVELSFGSYDISEAHLDSIVAGKQVK